MAQPGRQAVRKRGNIEELASGALRVRVYAGIDPVTKKQHYLTETIPPGPKAEQEAEKARVRLVNQVNERRNPKTKATVSQLIEKYLAVVNIDPGTRRGYERNFRNHVKPLLGSEQAAKVDAQTLDSFYAELLRCRRHCSGRQTSGHECKPLRPSTVRRIHFLLSGAFTRAVRWGWIPVNPATMAQPPPEPPPNPQPPSPEEAALVLNASWEDPDWHAFVWTAMTTGARRAELCALRWHKIDLNAGTLNVRTSIDQSGGEPAEKDTKSHQHRRIALDAETITVLAAHRERCEERAEALGIQLPRDAYVFSLAPDGSAPLKPDTVTQRYGRLVKRLKINTTLHELRHYSATELIAAGVDARTVGGRLGHAGGGSTTLRVYSAWVAESDQRAAKSLSARMPTLPTEPFDRSERAKTHPKTAAEKIAAEVRRRILAGGLPPGSPAPSQKEIAAKHHVSADTAHRAMQLLREWKLVETSSHRRGVVVAPPDADLRVEDRALHDTSAASDDRKTGHGEEPLELRLLRLSAVVRTFTAEADPTSTADLRRLLANAARRHAGSKVDLSDYELEVRHPGSNSLLTIFAAS